MYSKFKLEEFSSSEFEEYEADGYQYYKNFKTNLEYNLDDFIKKTKEDIDVNEISDGTKLQNYFFPTTNKFNVFLSHSHDDKDLAIAIAGFLKVELGLNTFIDSCLWGYADNLLKEIDNEYCKFPDGASYNYNKRNKSTAHVHMMLSVALSTMIDNCEAFFFLNTPQSISFTNDIDTEQATGSPWIYSELSLANLIRTKKRETFRKTVVMESFAEDSHTGYSALYNVSKELKNFIPLTPNDLRDCANSVRNKRIDCSLDYIYYIKKLIKYIEIIQLNFI